MPPVPLAVNAYKRSAGFQPEVRCRNMYLEPDKSGASPDNYMRLDRPGLSEYVAIGSDPIRGVYRQDGLFNGGTYAASGSKLYSIDFGAATELGDIGTGNRVMWAANYENLLALSSYVPFLYDGATVSGVVMPDARDVQDADVLNNYFILGCPDGRFYWIVPGESTVDALNFATAESSPDGLVAVKVIGDELVLFGVKRGEVWQPTGDADAPFLRAQGRNFDRGCMSRDAVLPFDNTVIFVGDDAIVYRFGNIPQRISDHGIEQRLRDRTDLPSACLVEADGHKHYVLKIPGQGSFGFDPSTQQWCEMASFDYDEWRPHVSAQIEAGTWILGAADTGTVWLYDPDAVTDDGDVIERIISGTVPLMGLPPRNDSISIGAGGSANYSLQFRWKDGQDDFPDLYEQLEVRAPADIISIYRLGAPEQPFRTFELRITDAVRARISGMAWGEAWR